MSWPPCAIPPPRRRSRGKRPSRSISIGIPRSKRGCRASRESTPSSTARESCSPPLDNRSTRSMILHPPRFSPPVNAQVSGASCRSPRSARIATRVRRTRLTKLAADDKLRATSLEWVVLRPSLVHARGAYGGTSALRSLAAYPFVIPVPGSGTQRFQPIWIDDLSRVVALALESDTLVRKTIDPVGPDAVTLREMLEDYRKWLGFARAPVVQVPMWMVRIGARLGDFFGGTFNSTALAQLEHGNTGDAEAFARATGISALGWKKALETHPAHAQDRWHARIYLVRPLLRASLAFLWLASAVVGVFAVGSWASTLAMALDIPVFSAGIVLVLACLADLVVALLLMLSLEPAPPCVDTGVARCRLHRGRDPAVALVVGRSPGPAREEHPDRGRGPDPRRHRGRALGARWPSSTCPSSGFTSCRRRCSSERAWARPSISGSRSVAARRGCDRVGSADDRRRGFRVHAPGRDRATRDGHRVGGPRRAIRSPRGGSPQRSCSMRSPAPAGSPSCSSSSGFATSRCGTPARAAALGDEFHRLFRRWFALGWPAFISMMLILWLMVSRPS